MWQNKTHSSESLVSEESDVSERRELSDRCNSRVWSDFGDGGWKRFYNINVYGLDGEE